MADLTDVISNSLANAGLTGGDSDGDGGDIGGGEEAAAPEQAAEADTAPAADSAGTQATAEGDPAPPADTEASEAPVEPVVPAQRKGPIPFAKHEKILSNERTKHKGELEALHTRLKSVEWAESAEAKARVQAMGAAETHPELFASAILADTRLGPIFRRLVSGEAAPAAVEQPKPPVGRERPKPNVTDANGNLGYDEAGLQALLDWTAEQGAAQGAERAQKLFEEKYGKEIAPIVEDRKKAAAWQTDLKAADRAINTARAKWHGFKEREGDIKAYLIANQTATLEDGYQAVVVQGLRSDRTKMREEIMAEMNGKKRIAAPRPAAVTSAPVGGKRSMEDVIKGSLAAQGLLE